MLPVQPPLPTAWKRPFQPVLPTAPSARGSGSHTSILMSESLVGVSVAATRQNAGAAAKKRRAAGAGGGAGRGGTNVPAATGSAALTVICGIVRPASDSHDAARA